MSYETIGYNWYEWNSHGDEKKEDNIKIVVYGGSLEKAKEEYKDNQSLPVDYRFLSKNEAIDYLERNIKEVQLETDLSELLNKLKETKKRILDNQKTD